MEKLQLVNEAGIGMLEICERAGARMGFGTDLIAEMGVAQSTEFVIRARAQKPADILRSATSVNAEILQMSGKLGVVAPGVIADLIVVDGNPLEKIDLLAGQGENIPVVMKGGAFHRNALGARASASTTTVSLAS
jgi:imidazolonepropionase-like amidohydrolase